MVRCKSSTANIALCALHTGVFFLYVALKALTWACQRTFGPEYEFRSGHYGEKGSYKPYALITPVLFLNAQLISLCRRFLLQLGVYCVAIGLMKVAVLLLFWLTADAILLPFAVWLINWMSEKYQLIFVMAVFPLIMNVIQVRMPESTFYLSYVRFTD